MIHAPITSQSCYFINGHQKNINVVKETIVPFNLRFIEYDSIIYFLDANFYEVTVYKNLICLNYKILKVSLPYNNHNQNANIQLCSSISITQLLSFFYQIWPQCGLCQQDVTFYHMHAFNSSLEKILLSYAHTLLLLLYIELLMITEFL